MATCWSCFLSLICLGLIVSSGNSWQTFVCFFSSFLSVSMQVFFSISWGCLVFTPALYVGTVVYVWMYTTTICLEYKLCLEWGLNSKSPFSHYFFHFLFLVMKKTVAIQDDSSQAAKQPAEWVSPSLLLVFQAVTSCKINVVAALLQLLDRDVQRREEHRHYQRHLRRLGRSLHTPVCKNTTDDCLVCRMQEEARIGSVCSPCLQFAYSTSSSIHMVLHHRIAFGARASEWAGERGGRGVSRRTNGRTDRQADLRQSANELKLTECEGAFYFLKACCVFQLTDWLTWLNSYSLLSSYPATLPLK